MLGKDYKKPIERLMYRKQKETMESSTPAAKTRDIIARRGALEFKDGMYGKGNCAFFDYFILHLMYDIFRNLQWNHG